LTTTLTTDFIVIGDFGLAVEFRTFGFDDTATSPSAGANPHSPVSYYTTAVGTHTYSSPEQSSNKLYNEKSDIYSLGMIFFELFYKFSTGMERAKILSNLKKHILPSDFMAQFPDQSAFILRLLSNSPDNRPSVPEILKSATLNPPNSETIIIAKKKFVSMQEKLKQQDELLAQQEAKIEQLRLMLESQKVFS